MKRGMLFLFLLLAGNACRTIQEGHLGVERRFGKQSKEVLGPGLYFYNPIWTDIIVLPLTLNNIEVKLQLPSREGLNIEAEISILYKLREEKVPSLLIEFGGADFHENEERIVVNVFRSAAADVSARFLAKDMHTNKRAEIENEILKSMRETLEDKGFMIQKVLLKSIRLPQGLYSAIEEKLRAEQDAQRMEYVLQQERREAERRKVEAMGVRDSQKILSEGLSKEIIQLRMIEAFRELAKSPNTKIIITDGKTPIMIPEAR
ncbi:MAG: prohibitin family protein [Turneriella sp.]|nr:prohibitin family protein [Turneriella sp.]